MKPVLAALLGCCVATAAGACDGLAVERAWVREPPPGTTVAAAYFELINRGTSAVKVTAVTSPDFGWAMLHATQVVDGRAEMRELGALELAPAAHFSATPGAVHLMLGEPRHPLAAASAVTLAITCAAGPALSFPAPVRRTPPP